jgi:O-antigen/teichoic acid export membrane protein
VLFPAFALTHEADSARAAKLFGAGNRAIFVTLFPVVLVVVAFSHEILALWLGGDFAERSETVMQLLALGVFGNGLAQVAFGFVQSSRPALSALIELAEVPFFVVAIVLLTHALGIEGAALAWAGRQLLDAVVLHTVSGRMAPAARPDSRALALAALVGIAAFGSVAAIDDVVVKAAVVAVELAIFVAGTWFLLLADDEKATIRGRVQRIARPLFSRA